MKRLCCVLLAGLVAVSAWGWSEENPSSSPVIALVGARLLTQTDAGDMVGTLLLRDGKIAALGPNLEIPAEAKQINLAGYTVSPGLIDCRSSLYLPPEFARDNGRDGSLQILDTVNPYSEDWREVAQQGVTTVYVQPSSGGNLGGFGAVLKVGPATQVSDLVIKADAGLQASLGLNANNALLRYSQFDALKKFVEAAKKYRDDKPAKPDPLKERHKALLIGELPLRLEAHYDDDLLNALKLADEFKLRLILEGVSLPKAAAAQLQKRRTPVILGPLLDLEPLTPVQRQRDPQWPNHFLAADARFGLGTFSSQPRASQWLRLHAATLVGKGIAPDRVLRALTADAADLLGVGDQLGKLAVGQRATLAVFGGDPLDTTAGTRLVLVDGVIVHDDPKCKPAAEGPTRVNHGLVTASLLQDSTDETTDPATPELRPADRFDPANRAFRDLKAAGFSTALLVPPASNVVAGELVSCELAGRQPTLGKTVGMQFVLTGAARNRERYPASLACQREVIHRTLAGQPVPSRLFLPAFVGERIQSIRQEAARRLISQKQTAYFHAEEPAEIEAALEIIEQHGLRAVLVQPSRVLPYLEDLKRLQVAVLVPPLANGDYSPRRAELAAASREGVVLLFGAASPQRLRATAAAIVQAGAEPERILAGLTTDAQTCLGLAPPPRTVTWTGSPLRLCSQPQDSATPALAGKVAQDKKAEQQ